MSSKENYNREVLYAAATKYLRVTLAQAKRMRLVDLIEQLKPFLPSKPKQVSAVEAAQHLYPPDKTSTTNASLTSAPTVATETWVQEQKDHLLRVRQQRLVAEDWLKAPRSNASEADPDRDQSFVGDNNLLAQMNRSVSLYQDLGLKITSQMCQLETITTDLDFDETERQEYVELLRRSVQQSQEQQCAIRNQLANTIARRQAKLELLDQAGLIDQTFHAVFHGIQDKLLALMQSLDDVQVPESSQ